MAQLVYGKSQHTEAPAFAALSWCLYSYTGELGSSVVPAGSFACGEAVPPLPDALQAVASVNQSQKTVARPGSGLASVVNRNTAGARPGLLLSAGLCSCSGEQGSSMVPAGPSACREAVSSLPNALQAGEPLCPRASLGILRLPAAGVLPYSPTGAPQA